MLRLHDIADARIEINDARSAAHTGGGDGRGKKPRT